MPLKIRFKLFFKFLFEERVWKEISGHPYKSQQTYMSCRNWDVYSFASGILTSVRDILGGLEGLTTRGAPLCDGHRDGIGRL